MCYILADMVWFENDYSANCYYGGRNEKYRDMINLTTEKFAKRFENLAEAQDVADNLNRHGLSGWNFEIRKVA